MDEIFGILMEQIVLFLFYMIVGVLLVKTHILAENTLETLSRFVMKLALPVMIFINTVGGVDRESLVQSLPVLGLAVVFYVCTFLISKGLSVLFHLKGDRAAVYRALSMFGNIGFMGIPIISSLFPEQGMLYISVFTIIDQLVLWTLGVKLTTPGGTGSFRPQKMINPCTVAVVAAVLIVVAGVSLPSLLHTALDKIGDTATPLAMIYLGGVFACMDVKTYVRVREFYGIVVVKMMVFPVLLYMACGFLPIDESVRLTFALLAAMPAMSSIVMMAKASGSEGDYAMGGIFVTTVCSIVSIPVVFLVLQQVAQIIKV